MVSLIKSIGEFGLAVDVSGGTPIDKTYGPAFLPREHKGEFEVKASESNKRNFFLLLGKARGNAVLLPEAFNKVTKGGIIESTVGKKKKKFKVYYRASKTNKIFFQEI